MKRMLVNEDPRQKILHRELLKHHWQHTKELIERRLEPRHGYVYMQQTSDTKRPTLSEGILNIFPSDVDNPGACPELSPSHLGPVIHNQPTIPNCVSVERYRQFNKFDMAFDLIDGLPSARWSEQRDLGYCGFLNLVLTSDDVDSAHFTIDGQFRLFNPVESRFFYCKAYEVLAKKHEKYAALLALLKQGFDLCICGPEAGGCDDGDLYSLYLDKSRPFGHEMILYSMLRSDLDQSECPWNRYQCEHEALYSDCGPFL